MSVQECGRETRPLWRWTWAKDRKRNEEILSTFTSRSFLWAVMQKPPPAGDGGAREAVEGVWKDCTRGGGERAVVLPLYTAPSEDNKNNSFSVHLLSLIECERRFLFIPQGAVGRYWRRRGSGGV